MMGTLPDASSPAWDELKQLVERQAGQPIASYAATDDPTRIDIIFEDGSVGHLDFIL